MLPGLLGGGINGVPALRSLKGEESTLPPEVGSASKGRQVEELSNALGLSVKKSAEGVFSKKYGSADEIKAIQKTPGPHTDMKDIGRSTRGDEALL